MSKIPQATPLYATKIRLFGANFDAWKRERFLLKGHSSRFFFFVQASLVFLAWSLTNILIPLFDYFRSTMLLHCEGDGDHDDGGDDNDPNKVVSGTQ